MMRRGLAGRILGWLGMAAALGVAVVVAIVVIRQAPRPVSTGSDRPAPVGLRDSLGNLRAGVLAILSAGDISVERTLPALAFSLTEHQSLDRRLSPGPFEGEFQVTFNPGPVRRARLGAEVQGGSLLIQRDGKPLLSDYAGAEARVVMTPETVFLPRRAQTFTYHFRADGNGPTRLRALWLPEGSFRPLALPSGGAALFEDDGLRGSLLALHFNCVACHASENPRLQGDLDVNPAPILGHVGQRVRPAWLRRWLAGPAALKPGAAMPRLFGESAADAERIEDLVHFLVSLGGPIDPGAAEPDEGLAPTGMLAYHQVGCFACHGPLEPLEVLPGGRESRTTAGRTYTPLGPLRLKTTPAQLAAFLLDPVSVRPSGRMPGQNLTPLEAKAIASYLFGRETEPLDAAGDAPMVPDPERIDRGRTLFASAGCAACHTLGPDRSAIEPTLAAPALEALLGADPPGGGGGGGCLAVQPPAGVPDFGLDDVQRGALRAFLADLPLRRSADVPHDRLALTLERLNCLACHEFHADGGPEPAVGRYFTTAVETDLGDEGRMPPDLTDLGAKLNPHWLRQVLEDSGRARAYQAARMPQFGEVNVRHLPGLFAAAAGTTARPDDGPAATLEYTTAGRHLIGETAFNCIQCHTIAGRDSTGTPGPDLARMAERLRYDYFVRWVQSPQQIRPGTRMPTFFFDGVSGIRDHLGGSAPKQIDAMWAYLSLGEHLPLPEGLPDPGGLILAVNDEPVVFRTYMAEAGVRAIACGFPEQIHYAFDTDRCRLALVWQGHFLDAHGAWAARGGSETNPSNVVWTAPADPLFAGLVWGGATATADAHEALPRFRGYRLDAERRPVFLYDLCGGGEVIHVSEQPIPHREGQRSWVRRRFELTGPAHGGVRIDPAGQRVVDSEGRRLDGPAGMIEILLGADGRAVFETELVW